MKMFYTIELPKLTVNSSLKASVMQLSNLLFRATLKHLLHGLKIQICYSLYNQIRQNCIEIKKLNLSTNPLHFTEFRTKEHTYQKIDPEHL